MTFGVFACKCVDCQTAFIFFSRTATTIERCPVCFERKADAEKPREDDGA